MKEHFVKCRFCDHEASGSVSRSGQIWVEYCENHYDIANDWIFGRATKNISKGQEIHKAIECDKSWTLNFPKSDKMITQVVDMRDPNPTTIEELRDLMNRVPVPKTPIEEIMAKQMPASEEVTPNWQRLSKGIDQVREAVEKTNEAAIMASQAVVETAEVLKETCRLTPTEQAQANKLEEWIEEQLDDLYDPDTTEYHVVLPECPQPSVEEYLKGRFTGWTIHASGDRWRMDVK